MHASEPVLTRFHSNHSGRKGLKCTVDKIHMVGVTLIFKVVTSTHGSRDRMWSPINWRESKTSNWYSSLILKFNWLNSCQNHGLKMDGCESWTNKIINSSSWFAIETSQFKTLFGGHEHDQTRLSNRSTLVKQKPMQCFNGGKLF